MVMQQKIHQPVKFEITEQTRNAIKDWVTKANLKPQDYLFPSRIQPSAHITTRQYARPVKNWVKMIGLDPTIYGTHSPRPRSFTNEPETYA